MKVLAKGGPFHGEFIEISDRAETICVSSKAGDFVYKRERMTKPFVDYMICKTEGDA